MPEPELPSRKPGGIRWKTFRKPVQYTLLGLFLLLIIMSRRGAWDVRITGLPVRLDPLTMLANTIADRSPAAWSLPALLTVALTLLLGRVWCGWICPLGTILDLCKFKPVIRESRISQSWRSVKYSLLVAILVAAAVANLTLLIFDPINLLIRSISAGLLPALDTAVTALENALFTLPFLQNPLVRFDEWIRPVILPLNPALYRDGILVGLVFFTVVGLNVFTPRFWCRYLCPLGAMLGLIGKAAFIRREVKDTCTSCSGCARRCPTATIDPSRNFTGDPGECIVCMDCIDDCPNQSNIFRVRSGKTRRYPYDPGRRQVFGAAAAALAGVVIAQSAVDPNRPHPHLIQPPGARDHDLLEKCIRCGLCSRACPTNAIQPAIREAGLVGLWTPVLVMRSGYCDYSCNACGQVCPVQAIPPLTLEEKRSRVLGIAVIDRNRCIPWSQYQPCIVCEEMCPVPDKAIILEKPAIPGNVKNTENLMAPRVLIEKCIGCGICEYRCPASGESAIRIFSINST